MRATVRCLAVASACAAAVAIGSAQLPNAPASSISFTDVAREAGLVHPSIFGGIDRKRYIIETNGAGVALVDVDRDGWLDALVLAGTRLDGAPDATNRLYRNKRDGTFEDITERAGVRRTAWSSSVCAGDYDNDGWIDLFVTAYGQNVLYRNREGRFEDVTAAAGLATTGVRWGSGCSFVDLDRDGRLDLFVANYLKFDLESVPEPGTGPNCLWKGIPVNCGPKGLPTDTNLLYHNDGNGRFSDISERSGIARVTGRYSMTAVGADLTDDGWPDIYVASDSTAAILYRNNRDGTFTDIAVESGTAYSEHGSPQAGMGVAVGDYNGDGRLDLAKTHFSTTFRRSIAISARACSRMRLSRRVCTFRTATCSGAPGWPTSTTTASRISSTSPGTCIRRSSARPAWKGSIHTRARASCSAMPATAASRTSAAQVAQA